jgi:hypothetical protein
MAEDLMDGFDIAPEVKVAVRTKGLLDSDDDLPSGAEVATLKTLLVDVVQLSESVIWRGKSKPDSPLLPSSDSSRS